LACASRKALLEAFQLKISFTDDANKTVIQNISCYTLMNEFGHNRVINRLTKEVITLDKVNDEVAFNKKKYLYNILRFIMDNKLGQVCSPDDSDEMFESIDLHRNWA
jgi:hypothetical protein